MKNKFDYAYGRSVEVMRELMSVDGFLASKIDKDNYKRVFARDGVILGIASLLIGEKDLIECFKKTLMTLREFQGKEGEIPSNVLVNAHKVSYGGTTGRVDATLWYIIGISQYVKRTEDLTFLKESMLSIKRCINLLESWEFNQRGFIYVPHGGDWADEYVNDGYVLYDEILYYRALKEYSYMLKKLNMNTKIVDEKIVRLKKMIVVNFWPNKKNENSSFVYHKGMYEQLKKRDENRFFVASFSPGGFINNFDTFGNSLAILFGFCDKNKFNSLLNYVNENFDNKTKWLMPAFWPIIISKDRNWTILKTNFSYDFKNHPHHYHNGGLWPLTTGFFISSLVHKKNDELALKYFQGLIKAIEKDDWAFCEYVDSKNFLACGTRFLGFSPASFVIAYNCIIEKKKIFI